ncbi:MAG: lysophospholipid acyltransferase family protein [Veillonellaceae bacterium]|nr:lysophospholipid acyltransferase family protein [Veillonellaceae bacterium]
MGYYLIKLISRIACMLPASVCDWLGKRLTDILWPFVPTKRKRMAEGNVKLCLGVDDDEARRIVEASAKRFGPMLFEVLRFPVINKHMDDYVEVVGKEYMKKGLELGRGAVIATSHSGNWELMGGALSHAGFPIVGVAMKQKNAAMDRFINEYRRLIGMHITYKNDVREMLRMMKDGWVIGLLMDQDTNTHDGIILDFFGRKTNCVPGPASMARFRDVPIFPVHVTRLPNGKHRVIINPAIFVEKTADKRADIAETMQKLNDILEKHVREHPEEWFWLHDRWKSMREE